MSTPKAQNQQSNLATKAGQNFEANVRKLVLVVEVMDPELNRHVRTPTAVLAEHIAKLRQQGLKPQGDVTDRIKAAAKQVEDGVERFLQLHGLLHEWLSVMLVAFIEAYLEDGLAELAAKNPTLLRNAAPIDCEAVLEANSIESLQDQVRAQWAAQTVRGGPKNWLARLKQMGARGYNNDVFFRLRHLQDTRNLIVHARSRATAEYLKEYKDPDLKPGDRIRVNGGRISWWMDGVRDFVERTDRFFSSYGNSRAGHQKGQQKAPNTPN